MTETTCNICAQPADESEDDWNPDTGNHKTCEFWETA